MAKKNSVFKSKAKTKGISFGLTSGVIATLGMIVGLESALKTNVAIIAGILSIAIADAFSDALGIHISEEAEAEHSNKSIWAATIYTFLSKFGFAIIFVLPFLMLNVINAMILSIIFGFIVIGSFSYIMAKKQNSNPWKAVGEHLLISIIVIIATHYVGDLIGLII
ncbi:MAG: VIT1/CCC1 transporter family protein [Candidatus Woesearchaeota archaeon]